MKGTSKYVTAMLVLTAVPAFAATPLPETSENVTVVPPYTVTKASAGLFNDREGSVTVAENVGYGDLDLSTPAGENALENRVKLAAMDVCHELDRHENRFRYTPIKSGSCVDNAEHDALRQAHNGGIRTAALR